MKRIFMLLLVFSIVFGCMCFPAFATTTESDFMNDILALQATQPGVFQSGDSTSLVVSFTKPNTSAVTYCEAIIRSNATDLTAVAYDRYTCDIYKLSDHSSFSYYKITFTGTYGSSALKFTFTSSKSNFYVVFNTCKYSIAPMLATAIEGYASISSPNYNDIIEYRPTDETNERQWTDVNNNPNYSSFGISCFAYDWKAYDYIDFQLLIRCSSINSISCSDGSTGYQIPCELTYVDTSSNVANQYVVGVRMDVRDLRTSSYPNLDIQANVVPGGLNIVRVVSIAGVNVTGDTNFFVFWFRKIVNSLDTFAKGNSQDQADAEDFTGVVEDELVELGEISTVIGSMEKPNVSDFDFNINSMVSPSTLTLSTSGIKTALSNEILLKVLIIAMTLGLCGFILYGKK